MGEYSEAEFYEGCFCLQHFDIKYGLLIELSRKPMVAPNFIEVKTLYSQLD
jgi:hypothetical protein